jgi:chromosome segregation ATPase
MSDTPETDALTSVGLENADRECVPSGFARILERERDEAREERDIARLEAEEINQELVNARKQIEGLNNFANERFDEIQKVRKERDEAREVLKEIAEAIGFDNIGNWARNKALEALKTK